MLENQLHRDRRHCKNTRIWYQKSFVVSSQWKFNLTLVSYHIVMFHLPTDATSDRFFRNEPFMKGSAKTVFQIGLCYPKDCCIDGNITAFKL